MSQTSTSAKAGGLVFTRLGPSVLPEHPTSSSHRAGAVGGSKDSGDDEYRVDFFETLLEPTGDGHVRQSQRQTAEPLTMRLGALRDACAAIDAAATQGDASFVLAPWAPPLAERVARHPLAEIVPLVFTPRTCKRLFLLAHRPNAFNSLDEPAAVDEADSEALSSGSPATTAHTTSPPPMEKPPMPTSTLPELLERVDCLRSKVVKLQVQAACGASEEVLAKIRDEITTERDSIRSAGGLVAIKCDDGSEGNADAAMLSSLRHELSSRFEALEREAASEGDGSSVVAGGSNVSPATESGDSGGGASRASASPPQPAPLAPEPPSPDARHRGVRRLSVLHAPALLLLSEIVDAPLLRDACVRCIAARYTEIAASRRGVRLMGFLTPVAMTDVFRCMARAQLRAADPGKPMPRRLSSPAKPIRDTDAADAPERDESAASGATGSPSSVGTWYSPVLPREYANVSQESMDGASAPMKSPPGLPGTNWLVSPLPRRSHVEVPVYPTPFVGYAGAIGHEDHEVARTAADECCETDSLTGDDLGQRNSDEVRSAEGRLAQEHIYGVRAGDAHAPIGHTTAYADSYGVRAGDAHALVGHTTAYAEEGSHQPPTARSQPPVSSMNREYSAAELGLDMDALDYRKLLQPAKRRESPVEADEPLSMQLWREHRERQSVAASESAATADPPITTESAATKAGVDVEAKAKSIVASLEGSLPMNPGMQRAREAKSHVEQPRRPSPIDSPPIKARVEVRGAKLDFADVHEEAHDGGYEPEAGGSFSEVMEWTSKVSRAIAPQAVVHDDGVSQPTQRKGDTRRRRLSDERVEKRQVKGGASNLRKPTPAAEFAARLSERLSEANDTTHAHRKQRGRSPPAGESRRVEDQSLEDRAQSGDVSAAHRLAAERARKRVEAARRKKEREEAAQKERAEKLRKLNEQYAEERRRRQRARERRAAQRADSGGEEGATKHDARGSADEEEAALRDTTALVEQMRKRRDDKVAEEGRRRARERARQARKAAKRKEMEDAMRREAEIAARFAARDKRLEAFMARQAAAESKGAPRKQDDQQTTTADDEATGWKLPARLNHGVPDDVEREERRPQPPVAHERRGSLNESLGPVPGRPALTAPSPHPRLKRSPGRGGVVASRQDLSMQPPQHSDGGVVESHRDLHTHAPQRADAAGFAAADEALDELDDGSHSEEEIDHDDHAGSPRRDGERRRGAAAARAFGTSSGLMMGPRASVLEDTILEEGPSAATSSSRSAGGTPAVGGTPITPEGRATAAAAQHAPDTGVSATGTPYATRMALYEMMQEHSVRTEERAAADTSAHDPHVYSFEMSVLAGQTPQVRRTGSNGASSAPRSAAAFDRITAELDAEADGHAHPAAATDVDASHDELDRGPTSRSLMVDDSVMDTAIFEALEQELLSSMGANRDKGGEE